ncbi:MAG: hypothetical protein OXE75_03640 [bacterium]|nr:hypothetical protein [bacterium]
MTAIQEIKTNWTKPDLVAGVCILLSFIGSLLPWFKLGPLGLAGIEDGPGVVVLVLSIVAAIGVAGFVVWRRRWLRVAALLSGLIMSVVGIFNAVNRGGGGDLFDDVFKPTVGSGLYLVCIGALGLVLSVGYGLFSDPTETGSATK